MKSAVVMAVLSVVFGGVGLVVVAGDDVFRPATYALNSPSPGLTLLALLAFCVAWSAPAFRIQLLCREHVVIPFWRALLVQLATSFGAAVTPGKAGAGVASTAAFSTLGLSVGQGFNLAIQQALLDLVFYSWALPLSLAYLVLSSKFKLPLSLELAGSALALVFVVALLFRRKVPRLLLRGTLWVARLPVSRRFKRWLRRTSYDYYRSAQTELALSRMEWLGAHAATALGWLSNYTLLWALLRLDGAEATLFGVLAVLTLVSITANVVPTPGGSGFIEVAVGLATQAPSSSTFTASLLLWRLGTFYLIFLVGPLTSWLLYSNRSAPPTHTRSALNKRDA